MRAWPELYRGQVGTECPELIDKHHLEKAPLRLSGMPLLDLIVTNYGMHQHE